MHDPACMEKPMNAQDYAKSPSTRTWHAPSINVVHTANDIYALTQKQTMNPPPPVFMILN